jgi:formylglycine-generating enzyme required for sulfatase activity
VSKVFVSHASADTTFAHRLAADLRRAGAEAWIYERDNTAGNIIARIDAMMAACDWLVLVLSPDAIASPYVQTEVYVAINRMHQGLMRGVVPIVARAFPPADLPPVWAALRRFDATHNYPQALAGVVAALGLGPSPVLPEGPVLTVAAPRALDPMGPRSVAQNHLGARAADQASGTPLVPGRLRDLGFTGLLRNGATYITPPLCIVPAGDFLMGSDKHKDKNADDDEKPQHAVAIGAYQIAMFPVTVAEYACFVRAGKRVPSYWDNQLQTPEHPVVWISWLAAVAYVEWLATMSGQPWRLPTEAEWERAARGSDGRRYPWGDQWDKTRANTRDGGPKTTTMVGAYSHRGDASPYGAHDMAGNIWEWCSSLYEPYPYSQNDRREDLRLFGNRVLRGGSWKDEPRVARVSHRERADGPGVVRFSGINVGFRLALTSTGAG